MAARCICGRSKQFPLCDGSHGDGWTCGSSSPVGVGIVAGPHLASLAERLAHQLGGSVITEAAAVSELIVLTDGSDLPWVKRLAAAVQAQSRKAVVVEAPISVGVALPGFDVVSACPPSPLHVWRAVLEALEQPPVVVGALHRGFLSHAVADEPTLEGPVDYLRNELGAELFVCADSIVPGKAWHPAILRELKAADRFVFVGSAASVASTFCAFEAGYAMATGTPTRVVMLDDSPPPAFLGTLQASSVPRTLARRPWLTPHEALLDLLLQALE